MNDPYHAKEFVFSTPDGEVRVKKPWIAFPSEVVATIAASLLKDDGFPAAIQNATELLLCAEAYAMFMKSAKERRAFSIFHSGEAQAVHKFDSIVHLNKTAMRYFTGDDRQERFLPKFRSFLKVENPDITQAQCADIIAGWRRDGVTLEQLVEWKKWYEIHIFSGAIKEPKGRKSEKKALEGSKKSKTRQITAPPVSDPGENVSK